MTDTTTNQETTTETTETEESLVTALEDKDNDESLITKGDEKDEAKPEPVEPLTVEDLVLPEGYEVDETAQAGLVEILNKGLPAKELAGELINLQTTMAQAASDSISAAWETMQDTWKQEAAAHPDFGGDKLAPTLGSIKELINEVSGGEHTPEAKAVFEALDLTGAGSNPALISLLAKLAAERAEGKLAIGDPTSPAQSLADMMFPNQGR